jgi:plasmid stabilization system protein ParE
MTRLVVTRKALADIERLAGFLAGSLPQVSDRTAGLIADGLEILKRHPAIGRPMGKGLRELVISRGRTGYLALYLYDAGADAALVLGVRHQREAGYSPD